jgi:hypothetical protein
MTKGPIRQELCRQLGTAAMQIVNPPSGSTKAVRILALDTIWQPLDVIVNVSDIIHAAAVEQCTTGGKCHDALRNTA